MSVLKNDFEGVEDHTPKRVACLQPSATSTVAALGMLDRVVACTRHCIMVCPDLDLTRVELLEDSWTAQAEQIKSAKADLVIASVPYQTAAVEEILKSRTRFLGLAPHTLSDIYGDIASIAALLGVPDRGATLIAEMQKEIAEVRARTKHLPRPRAFCEEWGNPISISQPWVAELVDAAGGAFLGEAGTKICAEGIQVENPEILVFAWCGAGARVPVEKIVREREWGYLRAVRQGSVFVIRDEFLTTPGPPLMIGLRALAHAIHPETFPDTPRFEGTEVMRQMGEPVVK